MYDWKVLTPNFSVYLVYKPYPNNTLKQFIPLVRYDFSGNIEIKVLNYFMDIYDQADLNKMYFRITSRSTTLLYPTKTLRIRSITDASYKFILTLKVE